jgi:hypothetical protein
MYLLDSRGRIQQVPAHVEFASNGRDQLANSAMRDFDTERRKRLIVDIYPACNDHSSIDALRGPGTVRLHADPPK